MPIPWGALAIAGAVVYVIGWASGVCTILALMWWGLRGGDDAGR